MIFPNSIVPRFRVTSPLQIRRAVVSRLSRERARRRKVKIRDQILVRACIQCGCDQRYVTPVMLHDDLWKIVSNGNLKGHMCIPCIEKNLGRRIEVDDLKSTGWTKFGQDYHEIFQRSKK